MDKGGGGSGGSLKTLPQGYNFPKEYTEGTNTYLGNLDKYLGAEMGSRTNPMLGDEGRIAWQQFLQQTFGPTQYGQQLNALDQLDPTGTALRTQTGNDISSDLSKGTGLTDSLKSTIDQGTLRAQSQRGNIYGQAPVQAESFAEGAAGQNLYQQRLDNALKFQNSATPESWLQSVAPVSADRSMSYVNPNAGFLGTNAINQQFQNSLGLSALGQKGGDNSWMSSLGSIATIMPLILGAFGA